MHRWHGPLPPTAKRFSPTTQRTNLTELSRWGNQFKFGTRGLFCAIHRITLSARAYTVRQNHQTDLLFSSMIDITSNFAGCSRKEVRWFSNRQDIVSRVAPVSRPRTLGACGSDGRAVAGGLTLCLEDRSYTVHRHR